MRRTLLMVLGALLLTALVILGVSNSGGPPTVEWAFGPDAGAAPGGPGELATGGGAAGRREADGTDGAASGRVEDERPDTAVQLTGRVVDLGGVPVAGAEVFLTIRQVRRDAAGHRIVDPVLTDSRGRFRFRGPAYRRLSIVLEAFHADYAATVELRELGEIDPEVQLEDVVLRRGVRVAGRVVDTDGAGVAGASVLLEPGRTNPMQWGRRREQLRPESESDVGGYFEFVGVGRGAYRVRAEKRGYQQGGSPTLELAEDTGLTVDDIVLRLGTTLEGIVRDVRGRPVPRARIQVRAEQAQGTFRADAGADGGFEFEFLPAGTFALGVSASGFLDHEATVDPAAQPFVEVTLLDGLTVRGSVVDAAGAPVTRFAARPRRLSGLPSADDPAPDVGGPLGEPAPRTAPTQGGGAQGERQRDRVGSTTRSPFPADAGPESSHPDGQFSFEGLLEGVYVVDVTSSGHQDVRTPAFELRRDGVPPQLVVALPQGLRIFGTVRTPDGAGAAGATVELRQAEDAPPPPAGAAPGAAPARSARWSVDRIEADATGAYAFEHARPGRYVVAASSEGYSETESGPLDVASEVRQDLVLEAFGAIEGRVVADGSLDEVRVFAVSTKPGVSFRRTSRASTPVQADGTYRLENLSPGPYRVSASRGAGRSWLTVADDTQDVVLVPAGGTVPYNPVLRDPPVGTVVGRVTGARIPADLRVTVQAVTPTAGSVLGARIGTQRSARVDSSGSFSVPGVPEGEHTVRISTGRNRMVLAEQSVYVSRDREATVDVTLDLASVRGTVLSADGAAVTGSATFYRGRTQPPDGNDVSAGLRYRVGVRDGRFEADDLPRDRYCVEVTVGSRTAHTALTAADLDQPVVVQLPAR